MPDSASPAGSATTPDEASRPSVGGRLLSLDVLRGLTVMGMIIVNAAAGMKYGAEADVFPFLLHAHWDGLTPADLVFPAFLTMLGVSIPLALGRAREHAGFRAAQRRRIAGRTARLVLLGFILTNMGWFADLDGTTWRLFGVLQRIGLVYGACAVLFLLVGPKARAAIAAAILVLYWPLALLPSLDGLATDIWVRGHNFVASVDRVLLGAGDHIYVKGPAGYDPEGLLGTLPAIAQGLIGIAVGEFILRHKGRADSAKLAVAGAAMIVLGLVWGTVFPIVKDIWSSSFVLVTSGITIVAAAGLHLWLDNGDSGSRLRRILVAAALPFGINAIAAYVLHSLAWSLLGWDLLLMPFREARGVVGDGWASLLPIFMFTLFVWVCMDWLRRKRWIIKI